MTTTTHTLELPDVDLVYDVHGPLPTADGRPVLLMIGQPMCAEGFGSLARTSATEPSSPTTRAGWGGAPSAATASDEQTPYDQAEDLHALIGALGAGPVEVFGSSGGAVTGLVLVETHPEDVVTLVAHEPPMNGVLPDADRAPTGPSGASSTPMPPVGPVRAWRSSSR